jgi:hypothetical protein
VVEPTALHILSVRFKRSRNSPEEHGILIGGKDDVLIDMLDHAVPKNGTWYWTQDHMIDIIYQPPKKEGK